MKKILKKALHKASYLTAWSGIVAALLLHVLYYNILFDEKTPF